MKRVALVFCLLALPVSAGEFSDLVMRPGLFAKAQLGEGLRYRLTRHLPRGAEQKAPAISEAGRSRDGGAGTIPEGSDLLLVAAEAAGRKRLLLSYDKDGAQKFVAEFPAEGANPVLLYFLETLIRDVAAETGGSPFYLKNRVIEALGEAGLEPAAESLPPGQAGDAGRPAEGPADALTIELLPFAKDPNRARLGALADLRLRFRFDPEEPSRLLSLMADTALGTEGYSQRLELIGEAK